MVTAQEQIADFRAFYTKETEHGLWEPQIKGIYAKFREYDWSLFDEQSWREIVSISGIMYMIVPTEQKTKGIALHAIVYGSLIFNREIIKSTPKEFFDEELITHILEHSVLDIIFLPLEYIATTEHFQFMYGKIREVCTLVYHDKRHSPRWYENIFKCLPAAFVTKEFCEEAVTFFPGLLGRIPREYITQEMVDTVSLDKDPYETSLGYVPEEFKTKTVCMNFYTKNVSAIQYFPIEFISYRLVRCALIRDSMTIARIPKEFLTQELCNGAFDIQYQLGYASYKVVESIPAKFRTRDMCMRSIEHWYFPTLGDHLKYVPDEYKDAEFWQKVLDYGKLEQIPEEY